MSESSIPPPSSYPAKHQLLDHYPTVSMDIRLGRQQKNINFDYEAFEREAERLGIDHVSSSELQIRVSPRSLLVGGSYRPWKRGIDIKLQSRDEKTNHTLRHELKHAADHDLDRNEPLRSHVRYGLGKLAVMAAIPLSVWEGGRMTLLAINDSPSEIFTTLTPSGIAIMIAAGMANYGYYYHPKERRANKAAKETNARIISTKNQSALGRLYETYF